MLRLDLVLYAGCAQTGSLRWQSGGPPPALATDVPLTGCTATASMWLPQGWSSPIVTITTTPSANGSISIGTFSGMPGAQVPSVVTWNWTALGVSLLLPVPPIDEARLNWGLNVIFPSSGPWPLIRGRVTVRP